MNLKEAARNLLHEFKGDRYVFGLDCLNLVGRKANSFGKRALLIANPSKWSLPTIQNVESFLLCESIIVTERAKGAQPNTPREDVYRLQHVIDEAIPEMIIAVGSGSTIDAAKAAAALAVLSPGIYDVEPLFGMGKVTELLKGEKTIPIIAVQTAASSAAHLTRYSNVTDVAAGQKKLIVDDAIIPPVAIFDYSVTASASKELTADGALDGISHSLEVYYGAKGEALEKVEPVALTGIELIVNSVTGALRNPQDLDARKALGLGTDLGGYSIMIGGTNAGHLTSFSLVDVTTHGRACAIMNPYYTVLFAPAIQRQLRALAPIYQRAGLLDARVGDLRGRDLALAVAEAMMKLLATLDMPTSLSQLPGFTGEHITRAISAAKAPELKMKLQQMPAPMDASMVDEHMLGVLEAAAEGNINKVKAMPGWQARKHSFY